MPNPHELPPAETVQLSILEWSRHLLRHPGLSERDNFIDAGGHSLLAVRLADLVESHFGVELDMATLFDHDLTAVAAHIEQQQTGRHLSA